MARRRIIVYLAILAAALVAWVPLYPVLYSLNYEDTFLTDAFEAHKPRFVYFGDSVLTTSSACETDHRQVSQFLPDAVADKTMMFEHGGSTASLWTDIARFVAVRSQGSVSTAIVELNMSAFSQYWASNPSYDFEPARMFYDLESGDFSLAEYFQYLADLHSVLKDYRFQKKLKRYEGLPIWVGHHFVGRLEDVSRRATTAKFPCNADLNRYATALKLHFDMVYGAAISADDPMFGYVADTVARLNKAHIRVILYLTPLDFEDIARFGGPELVAQLHANLALVHQVARRKGWELIDLSNTLPSRDFITRECSCEHVDAFGRALIARNVTAALTRTGR